MIEGLQHAVKHQTDAHASGEQHCEPACIREVRFRICAAQSDPSQCGEHQQQAEQDEKISGDHEPPVESGGQPFAHGIEKRCSLNRHQQRNDDKGDDRDGRDDKDRIVNVKAEQADIVLSRRVVMITGTIAQSISPQHRRAVSACLFVSGMSGSCNPKFAITPISGSRAGRAGHIGYSSKIATARVQPAEAL